jgi:hypothetical protein
MQLQAARPEFVPWRSGRESGRPAGRGPKSSSRDAFGVWPVAARMAPLRLAAALLDRPATFAPSRACAVVLHVLRKIRTGASAQPGWPHPQLPPDGGRGAMMGVWWAGCSMWRSSVALRLEGVKVCLAVSQFQVMCESSLCTSDVRAARLLSRTEDLTQQAVVSTR